MSENYFTQFCGDFTESDFDAKLIAMVKSAGINIDNWFDMPQRRKVSVYRDRRIVDLCILFPSLNRAVWWQPQLIGQMWNKVTIIRPDDCRRYYRPTPASRVRLKQITKGMMPQEFAERNEYWFNHKQASPLPHR